MPSTLLPLGDGNYHYNYNITTEEVTDGFGDGETRTQYVYDTVYIEGNPTITKITAAMKKERFTSAEIKAEKGNIRTAIENAKIIQN